MYKLYIYNIIIRLKMGQLVTYQYYNDYDMKFLILFMKMIRIETYLNIEIVAFYLRSIK